MTFGWKERIWQLCLLWACWGGKHGCVSWTSNEKDIKNAAYSGIWILRRASCRIRTNDPEITNHVLWPTELKRRVGKLSISRRYNQLPLLRSSPGGFIRSWPYRTYPFLFCECKGRHYFQNYNTFEYFFLILAEKIHFSPITIGRIPVKEVLLCTY